jgi:hypothetical protein
VRKPARPLKPRIFALGLSESGFQTLNGLDHAGPLLADAVQAPLKRIERPLFGDFRLLASELRRTLCLVDGTYVLDAAMMGQFLLYCLNLSSLSQPLFVLPVP